MLKRKQKLIIDLKYVLISKIFVILYLIIIHFLITFRSQIYLINTKFKLHFYLFIHGFYELLK